MGDLHGQDALFSAIVALARSEERYLVSLGDLMDRGPDSASTIRQMLDLVDRGRGLFIRGNHDDKLFRTLCGNPTLIDGELAVTLAALKAASDGPALKKRYVHAYREAPYVVRLNRTVMVHGALRPPMLSSRGLARKFRALAIYGEATHDPARKKPVRTYGWLDSVPGGFVIIIGHHPISDTSILVRENPQGGRIVHLDCGAGKGRGLGALRLDRDGEIENGIRAVLDAESGTVTIVPAPFAPVTMAIEAKDTG